MTAPRLRNAFGAWVPAAVLVMAIFAGGEVVRCA
jgi:hypothetical protein